MVMTTNLISKTSMASTLTTSIPEQCMICPRACGANRAAGQIGVCGADDRLMVARAALHFWEEPPVSGESGSGTIFFSHCPLHCVYCQNASIAAGEAGAEVTLDRLVQMMLELQAQGALNINFVTPTHYTPWIVPAVAAARKQGLKLPIVWNTSGYETVETVRNLADTVDVWLVDFKYAAGETAAAYSHAPDYPEIAIAAIDEMLAISGEPQYDEFDGQERMTKGVIIRHLLLPGHVEESALAVSLLHERYDQRARLSIMNQYTPVISPDSPAAMRYPNLLERVDDEYYDALLDFADELGVQDYFWQDGPADLESFIPAFDLTGVEPE